MRSRIDKLRQRVGMAAALLLAGGAAQAALQTVVCEGLGGETAYTEQFDAQVAAVKHAAATLGDTQPLQVLAGRACTREAFSGVMKQLARSLVAEDRVAVYLIGHGSFDGEEYRFNLPGPDITGRDLQSWLGAIAARDQLIVVSGSSSGALQELLKSPSRVVISATRSGGERNATRFGADFAAALTDAAADSDKNGSISAQEAFDFAQRRVKDYYEREVRIASEHAVLSGERAPRFTVARLAAGAVAGGPSGSSAAAAGVADSPERQKLTDEIEALRLRKGELPEETYNEQLETLLLKLAAIDAAAPAATAPVAAPAGPLQTAIQRAGAALLVALLAGANAPAWARGFDYGLITNPGVQRCDALRWTADRNAAPACHRALLTSADAGVRAEAAWALGDFKSANDWFRDALRAQPGSAVLRVRYGQLFADTHQNDEAYKLFQEALKLEPQNAWAQVAAAEVLISSFKKEGQVALNAALQAAGAAACTSCFAASS
jgi:tetratricopeptide (TPR) repeat protein